LNSEFDPNEFHESDLQHEKHDDPRMWTFRGIWMDLSDEENSADDSIRVNCDNDSNESDWVLLNPSWHWSGIRTNIFSTEPSLTIVRRIERTSLDFSRLHMVSQTKIDRRSRALESDVHLRWQLKPAKNSPSRIRDFVTVCPTKQLRFHFVFRFESKYVLCLRTEQNHLASDIRNDFNNIPRFCFTNELLCHVHTTLVSIQSDLWF
jgi:hypothetical protein